VEKKSNKNYWPHFIIASIIFIVISCVVTVAIAVNTPHDMDNSYMQKYQFVDENINEILLKQREFDKKFIVSNEKKSFKIGKNLFDIKIVDKEGNVINNAKIELLMTRPHTSKMDRKLKPIKNENGKYLFEFKDLKKENLGRWQIKSKITIDKYIGFYDKEISVTN